MSIVKDNSDANSPSVTTLPITERPETRWNTGDTNADGGAVCDDLPDVFVIANLRESRSPVNYCHDCWVTYQLTLGENEVFTVEKVHLLNDDGAGAVKKVTVSVSDTVTGDDGWTQSETFSDIPINNEATPYTELVFSTVKTGRFVKIDVLENHGASNTGYRRIYFIGPNEVNKDITKPPPAFISEPAPTPAPTPDTAAHPVSAVGDPHLVNLHGETFDLNVAGKHLLLQIPRGSGEALELVGSVEHLPTQVSGHSPCHQFLFTQLIVRGKYVDGHRGEISVDAGQSLSLYGFGATHRQLGKIAATPYASLWKQTTPSVAGHVSMWACKDNDPKSKKNLCKRLSSASGAGHRQLQVYTRKPAIIVMEVPGAGASPLHLAISRFEGASPAYLNVAFSGLGPADSVGGLLGSDDHTAVDKPTEGCEATHHAKHRAVVRNHRQDPNSQANRNMKRNRSTQPRRAN
jgi:hypothetical protein